MRCHSRLICNILERCVSALDIDLTFLKVQELVGVVEFKLYLRKTPY